MIQHKGFTIAPLVVRVFMCELPKEEEQPVEVPNKFWRGVGYACLFWGVALLFCLAAWRLAR